MDRKQIYSDMDFRSYEGDTAVGRELNESLILRRIYR
jgi:hypothetical protein